MTNSEKYLDEILATWSSNDTCMSWNYAKLSKEDNE